MAISWGFYRGSSGIELGYQQDMKHNEHLKIHQTLNMVILFTKNNHPFKRKSVLLTKNISVSNTHQFLLNPQSISPRSPVMSQHGAARTHGKLQESTWRVTNRVRRSQAAGVYGLPKLRNPTHLRFDQITITVVFAIHVGFSQCHNMPGLPSPKAPFL